MYLPFVVVTAIMKVTAVVIIPTEVQLTATAAIATRFTASSGPEPFDSFFMFCNHSSCKNK